MNKTASIILALGLLVGIGIIFAGSNGKDAARNTQGTIPNVEMRDGIQYVTITAKGGYSPEKSSAKAGIPTKLIIKTDGTYDCSSALVIRSLGFQKILPQNGETEIDLGTPIAGQPLQGMCSMGMYNFAVDFN